MSSPNYTAFDCLQWLAYRCKSTVDWVVDAVVLDHFDDPNRGEPHEMAIGGLEALIDEMDKILGPLVGHWGKYSDGRDVVTHVEIERGQYYTHLWSPDPTMDKPSTFIGRLIADPGQDNGTYEIHIRPPQTLEVVIHPPKPTLHSV
ncbi:hypothetical protein IU436_20255 [Nocardia farcinica]|uniref:hypothetical protein n=1 Tax=Nocardia farcinica TaxID=37329 RepID=UPI001895B154|nr:hypothetical protein [Nocardia farcinica]MBF6363183.1 hypothetical protein [Nocardia farcinica]MBF6420850.1 hypothetical protein [Nocardia farcinica]MBF6432691.1 hypothetical protein [Nocardia farcinica]MBF6503190.1 hypothetical protein [Nocardia farcinica]